MSVSRVVPWCFGGRGSVSIKGGSMMFWEEGVLVSRVVL